MWILTWKKAGCYRSGTERHRGRLRDPSGSPGPWHALCRSSCEETTESGAYSSLKRIRTRSISKSPHTSWISGLKSHVRSRRQSSQPNAGCPQTNTERRSVMLFMRTFLKRIALISFLSFYLFSTSRILAHYESEGFVKRVDFNFYFHLIVVPEEAGIQNEVFGRSTWIPAFASMTTP